MTTRPNPSGSDTIEQLASWLAVRMAHTGQSIADIAGDLGVSAETVRTWLGGGRPQDANEFAHLDTPIKLGNWLRARIAASGSSVRQIAATTEGVSVGTIYNWIRGEHLPRPPAGDEPDRFDLLLSNSHLKLNLRQRLQLDEIRRRLTGTSLRTVEPESDWPARGLPADNRSFTGRGKELKKLDRLLREHSHRRAVVISALTGGGGIGKTALAVHWARARQTRATFTDGCLYLNLNGYSETPSINPDEALTKLLTQLQVDPRGIPADPDARAALYQESLAGRKLLILLDNAQAEPQVRPLLPVDPNCLAIITSRNRLHGLKATDTDVSHLPLDTLTASETASLLRNLLGRLATKSASDDEIDALVSACGHLPLAAHLAAADYLTHHHSRHTSIGEYAEILAGDRLGRLAVGPSDPTTSVSAAMNRSYRHLTDVAQRTYRLLGLHPGPDFTVAVAASMTGQSFTQTRAVLTELTQANLLTEPTIGRFAFHDILRDHAAALVERTDSGTERGEAARRVLDHYIHTAHTATDLLDPITEAMVIPLGELRSGVALEPLASREALAWFEAEYPAMMAVASQAAGEFDVQVWQSAWTLYRFLALRGYWQDQIAVQQRGLAAARRLEDAAAQAYSHRILARTNLRLGRYADGRSHLMRAVELCDLAGDRVGQAAAYNNLGEVAQLQGELTEALEHSRRALELYEAAGDRFGEVRVLNSLGWFHARRGEYREALGHCERAFDLCLELDYRLGEANVADSLGLIHHGLANHAEAVAFYRRAHRLNRELGNRFDEAETLSRLGDLHRATGDREAARRAWQEAQEILAELDHANAAKVRARLAELDAPAVSAAARLTETDLSPRPRRGMPPVPS